jgi:uncharacterized protein (DUF2141 family)
MFGTPGIGKTMTIKSKMHTLLLCLTLSGFSNPSSVRTATAAGTLTIVINQFRNNSGEVSVALFNQEEAFPKMAEKAVRSLYAPIKDRQSVVVFDHLSAGEYAVSVFHDENNNKKMDANFLGIPKEGVGASNNARGHLGPPKYKDAKFLFNGDRQTIQIDIVYL